MQPKQTAVYYGPKLASYGFGDGHPFGPDRITAFWREFTRQNLDQAVTIVAPVEATRADLERFHTRDYIDRLRQQSATGRGFLDAGDTPAYRGIYEASLAVAGSVLDGARRIMEQDNKHAFVPIAGLHHARRDMAAGFCAINDIGILIETLREVHGLERIAYVDIDAHHGDGVFYAYEDDPDVWIADIHEDGRYLYPGTGFSEETGLGKAAGSKLNLPLTPPAVTDADFFVAWRHVEQFVRDSQAEFIVLQAGADSIAGDPITHMRLSNSAHSHAARQLARIAEESCAGRLLVTGGGGYNRENLATAWSAVVRSLLPMA